MNFNFFMLNLQRKRKVTENHGSRMPAANLTLYDPILAMFVGNRTEPSVRHPPKVSGGASSFLSPGVQPDPQEYMNLDYLFSHSVNRLHSL